MKVVILGSGNTASILGMKMLQAGHEILQVVSRREEAAAKLAAELQTSHATGWDNVDQSGDCYLAALSDDALYGLGSQLSLPGKLIVHTAGTVPLLTLSQVSARCGVLYPLQSLRKEIRPLPPIPFLVDAVREEDRQLVAGLARTISDQVRRAGDAERLTLHLGAVLVNNFSNYLYTLAEDFCRAKKTDFSLLLPIVRETADRLSQVSSRDVQTGPAIRGDRTSIAKHLELLSNHNDLKELYSVFTNQIEAYYGIGEIPPRL